MTEKTNEWLAKSLGEPDNSIEYHSYEIRPLTIEGRREWWMFHNGVGSGEPLAQWLEAYAAQQFDEIAELKKSVDLLHEAMVTAERRGYDKAMEEFAAQQSKMPTKEMLYKLAFREACDMLVRTGWYKTNASAEGSILTLIKKRL